MNLSGWGRYPRAECRTVTPARLDVIGQAVRDSSSIISRGNGRAYGDAAINPDGTLLMEQCDRLISFDDSEGILECEAGTSLADIISIFAPRGWFPPVVPGTKFVTIGGLIAADVHGKNHHVDGSFGRYVVGFKLMRADGTVMNCSPVDNHELFYATLGGMGLTGVILSAVVKLRRISSPMIGETIIKASSLDVLLELFEAHNNAPYSVAWIDCLATGQHFGRGILMMGEHAGPDVVSARGLAGYDSARGLSIPVELPCSPLNRYTIRVFNELFYRAHKSERRYVELDRYFFPLDKIKKWNYIYGPKGFIQYQFVVSARDALSSILAVIQKRAVGSFLAVLKQLGPGQRFLSFPRQGYTLTLDVPVHRDLERGLAELDASVSDHDGRIYLAKDARAPRWLIEKGYPDVEAFRRIRNTIDPGRKFRSLLSQRLDL